ncbi:hypothetical protein JHK87_001299 [Glycine soja]|nr:hypothetical protein JHK87_001299 [Glycine soja]
MTVMTPAPIDQQEEDEEMLVPHTDLAENNHQPMEDGREAVAKAANLIFVKNLKQHKLGGELDLQILLEPQLNEALQIVGSKGPEPDLLLVYGPMRSHLGFPAWGLRYTEIM